MGSLATSVPQEVLWERSDALGGFAAEFERLAGRACTRAEREVVARISDGCSVWAEGLLPEAFAYLAAALTSGEGLSVLFVSTSLDLLEHRQLRLGTRGPCRLLGETKRQVTATKAMTVWATPDRLDSAYLARAFGSEGPDVIMLEDAQALTSHSFSFRPSLAKVAHVIARFPRARFAASALARGNQLRAVVGKQLGIKEFFAKKSEQRAVVHEDALFGPGAPALRVERDPEVAIQAIVGPLPRPALVLCSTPAQADQVYARLESEQVPVHRIHSGLPPSERARQLVHFALPGRRAVMVAVSSFGPSSGLSGAEGSASLGGVPEAFGHGYARQDLRSLVHLCAPCSLDQYARELSLLATTKSRPLQPFGEEGDEGIGDESGRAAGGRSVALMLYDPAHLALNLALLERKRPSSDLLRAILPTLSKTSAAAPVELADLASKCGSSAQRVASLLEFLRDAELVRIDGTKIHATVSSADLKREAKKLEKSFEELNAGDPLRLEEVEGFALEEGCRAQALASRLGQPDPGVCGVCDACAPDLHALAPVEAVSSDALADPAPADPGSASEPFIEHRTSRRRSPARRDAAREICETNSEDVAFHAEGFYEDAGSA